MVLIRFLSLVMLTVVGLAFVINNVPSLMLPIYILSMIGLMFCLGYIALHYLQRIRYLLYDEKQLKENQINKPPAK
ncbi:hypothetical protein MHH29_00835 [Bacillus sp. FSL K6-0046]|uniref:hypothetical protein n=1 Tax=Bacillus TaxID=1386 RepID=UPI00119F0458|nr:hypothetical protein [Bacillus altitudinis]MCY7687861.1 hypothetical protein [Bacillus altitudinis]MCY7702283.1 hypothetical protein [Bacillus altitudinis]